MRRQSALAASSSRGESTSQSGYQASNGRRGYGREQDADEDEEEDYQPSNYRAQDDGEDVVHFRKRDAGGGNSGRGASDVSAAGLVSSSARERERERRERERERDRH